MLTVDFIKRKEYKSTQRTAFRLFLGILLVTFLSVMALEMRSILKTFAWCRAFPNDDKAGVNGRIVGKDAVQIFYEPKYEPKDEPKDVEDDDVEVENSAEITGKTRITAVRRDHRCLVFVVTVLRLLLWFFLLWSGVMFLTGPPRYLTLIFDALSLVFILEIDELLYRTMLRVEFKTDHLEGIDDMEVLDVHVLYGERAVIWDILRFLSVIAFSAAIVWTYTHVELDPLVNSLECLCTVDGSTCRDAQYYNRLWWDEYWSTTWPASNMIIDQLKMV
jgi:hypothetical protein